MRNAAISLVAATALFLSAGQAHTEELVSYSTDTGPEAGYGYAQGNPLTDGPADFMMFSDYPLSADAENQEKSPDDISTSELLHAYDAASSDEADAAVEEETGSGAQEMLASCFDGVDIEIISPLTVIKDDYKEPVERNTMLFSNRMGDRFKTWLSRSNRYIGLMKDIFRENGLPEDLVYLALIESGFNPKAYSWAKASGPWQFISSTGRKYGLKINWWVDERRDPVKSTKAAAEYLRNLYDMFGTWSLAMAAYNAGEGKVSRAVQKHGTLDYWELRKTRSLARETREYVPRYLAAKSIAKDPPSYGLTGIEYEEPFAYDEVEIDVPLSLDAAAKCCGTDRDSLKALNPELRRWCTPPNTPGYRLRVPKGTAEMFAANFGNLPDSEKGGWGEYVVRRGDTLGAISRKFNVPVSEVARMNNIRRVSLISVGQRLMIPGGSGGAVPAVYSEPSYADDDDGYATGGGTYRVRRGDNLWRIARRHGMSVQRLASLNGLSTRSVIRPGQRLKLSGSSASAASYSSANGTYSVRRGDTLSAIAGRHGMSVDSLAAINGISKHSVITPGQRLKVTATERVELQVGGSYRVQSGDTLWDISRRLGVSMDSLMRANSIGRRSILKPGQELLIPAKSGLDT